MNVVTLIGRVTKEPEIYYSQGERPVAVAKFSLAVDKWDGVKKSAVFINCVAFGKTAETIEKYVGKGQMLGVTGEIDTSTYEKEGRKYYNFNVKVSRIDFCGKSTKEKSEGQIPEGFSRLDTDMEDILF